MKFSTLGVVLGTAFGTTLSCIGVYFAYRRYALKSGLHFRGAYTMTSSIRCNDDYVSRIAIENVKDRAATIYAIYLRIGPNLYMTIEDFSHHPLVLAGFETYQKDFDPVDFYTEGTRRLDINSLLKNNGVRKTLVLSTSEGKRVVGDWIRRWYAIADCFRNHATGMVYPIRPIFKGRSYGSNALYLVEFKLNDGTEQVIPIYPRDYELDRFRAFRLTEESLTSKTELEALLNKERELGKLPVSSIEVYDLRQMRDDFLQDHYTTTIKAERISWLEYHFLSPILTSLDNWRLRRENKKRRRKRE